MGSSEYGTCPVSCYNTHIAHRLAGFVIIASRESFRQFPVRKNALPDNAEHPIFAASDGWTNQHVTVADIPMDDVGVLYSPSVS